MCPRPLCKSVMLTCRCCSWVVGVYGCSCVVCMKEGRKEGNKLRREDDFIVEICL